MRLRELGLLAWSIAASAPAWGQGEPPPSAPEPAGPGVRWTIPLLLSGAVSYDLRLDHSEGERQRVHQLLTATLNAASYIYQPWFALVNGQLGLTTTRASGGVLPGVERDQFVTGSLRLGLFPRSRFPLEARYEASDSRVDAALGGGFDYRASTFALVQRYRPADGAFAVSASYERRTQDGELIGEDTQETLLGDFAARWQRHNFNASLSRSMARRRLTDESTDFRNVVVRHSFGAGTELSVENSLNVSDTEDHLTLADRSLKLSQWSSLAMWRPTTMPLTVSASARGFKLDSDNGTSVDTVSLSVGVSYDITQRLRLAANLSVARNNGQTQDSLAGSLGGSYQGDTRKLGEYSHSWFAGMSVSRSRSAGETDDAVNTQLGHTISRTWGPTGGATWTITGNQTASVSHVSGRITQNSANQGLSRALTHTGGLTWSKLGAESNAFFRLSLTDARQFDGDQAQFQLLNAQLSGSHDLDRYQGWNGDLTLQRVFQRARSSSSLGPVDPSDPFTFDRQITHTTSGEISYRHNRVFNVPRLRFTSRLRLSHDAQRQSNALVSLPERETASWENRLDWQIGRLDASGILRLGRTDGVWRETLHLRVQRSFGD